MYESKPIPSEIEELVGHYNDGHPDTVLFIARHLASDLSLVDAEIVAVSRNKITFACESPSGNQEIVWPSEREIIEREHFSESFFFMLSSARRAADLDEPKTSVEKELASTAALKTYQATVSSVKDITSTIKEITVTGLEDFTNPGRDAFMFVFVPPDGEKLPRGFDMGKWRALSEQDRPGAAYYTIRRSRRAPDGTVELDLWFVVHETYGAVSDWAGRAKVGEEISLWGPRTAFKPPACTRQYIFLAEETSYAAVAAILDELPAESGVTVLLEAGKPGEEVPLRKEPHWEVAWVYRDGARPGCSTVMLDGVKALKPDSVSDLYLFGAGESIQIAKVRKYLRQSWSLSKPQFHLTGYWRILG